MRAISCIATNLGKDRARFGICYRLNRALGELLRKMS